MIKRRVILTIPEMVALQDAIKTKVAQKCMVKRSDIMDFKSNRGRNRASKQFAEARQIYLWLCLKNGIDMYWLSRYYGKERTTLACIIEGGTKNANFRVIDAMNKKYFRTHRKLYETA